MPAPTPRHLCYYQRKPLVGMTHRPPPATRPEPAQQESTANPRGASPVRGASIPMPNGYRLAWGQREPALHLTNRTASRELRGRSSGRGSYPAVMSTAHGLACSPHERPIDRPAERGKCGPTPAVGPHLTPAHSLSPSQQEGRTGRRHAHHLLQVR